MPRKFPSTIDFVNIFCSLAIAGVLMWSYSKDRHVPATSEQTMSQKN